MGLSPIKDYKYEYCKFDGAAPVATFMFSNPSRRNAVHLKTTEGLENAIQVIRENDDIRVLVLTGDPEGRAFCSGADVRGLLSGRLAREGDTDEAAKHQGQPDYELTPGTYLYRAQQEGGLSGGPEARQHPKGEGRTNYQRWRLGEGRGGFIPRRGKSIMELDKPVIAMVNDTAAGIGCDLIFHSDIIIASEERARFGWTYIHRGAIAVEGGTYFLSKLAGKHIALEILWRGDYINARQMYEWGLINHVVPDDELKKYTYDLADKLATGSPPMIMGAIKYVVHKGLQDYVGGLEDHLEQLVQPAMRSYAMSEDAKEGMKAFLEKRAPKYDFK